MQKLQTLNPSRSLGSLLRKEMSPGTLGKVQQGTLAKFRETTEAPAAQRPDDGLYAELFKATRAAKPLAKGMGNTAQLALLLKAILTLVQDQVAECEREGDASGVPAKLQDWLKAGGELLKEMTVEEVGELARAAHADDLRKGAQPAATGLPARLNVAPPTMKAPGESLAHGSDYDETNPAHVHNRHLRETADAHSKLLAAIRAQYAGPPVNPSSGPQPL